MPVFLLYSRLRWWETGCNSLDAEDTEDTEDAEDSICN